MTLPRQCDAHSLQRTSSARLQLKDLSSFIVLRDFLGENAVNYAMNEERTPEKQYGKSTTFVMPTLNLRMLIDYNSISNPRRPPNRAPTRGP